MNVVPSSGAAAQLEPPRSFAQARRALFSAFAVALGLGLIVGFLSVLREPPSPDFHGEWATLVFLACAAALLAPVLPRRFPASPILFALPLVFALLLVLQAVLGYYTYVQPAILWHGYLAAVALALLVGQGVRAAGLTVAVMDRVAWAILIAAILNAAAQFVQAARLEAEFAPFVLRHARTGCALYGNIGQANHAATLAWLGLGAVLFLHGTGKMGSRWAVPAVAILLMASALTASRMAWLVLGLTCVVLVALQAWPARDRRARWLIAAMLVIGALAANLGSSFVLAGVAEGCQTALERAADRSEGGLIFRLELWRQALAVWSTAPWIGVGAFNVLPTAYIIESFETHRPLDTYVHNAFLQVLAEFGVVGIAALLAVLFAVGRQFVTHRSALKPADAVGLLWLGILGIHSMLEFPLWYMHFLVLFSLVLGLTLRAEWSRHARALPLRVPTFVVAAVLLGGAGFLIHDYLKLARLYWIEDQRAAFKAAATDEVRSLLKEAAAEVRLFRVQADHLLGLSDPVTKDDLPRKIADTDRLLAQSPQPVTAARRIALAILDNDTEAARWHMQRLFGFFPRHAPKMAEAIREVADRRPDEFAALGPMLEAELARAPAARW